MPSALVAAVGEIVVRLVGLCSGLGDSDVHFLGAGM